MDCVASSNLPFRNSRIQYFDIGSFMWSELTCSLCGLFVVFYNHCSQNECFLKEQEFLL
jgi:hypothetical protein